MRVTFCDLRARLRTCAGILSVSLIGCLGGQEGSGDNGPPAAHVTLRILDASTGQPVPDVSVHVHDSESYRSDAEGTVQLDIYQAGDHLAILEKDGYATMEEVLGITSAEVESGDPVSKQRLLHPLRLGIKGRLTMRTPASDSASPAPGVGLEILFPENFRERRATATTDSMGQFAVSGLPEKTAFSLRVPEAAIDGRRLRLDAFPVPGAAEMSGTVRLTDFQLQPIPGLFAIIPKDSFDLGQDKPFTVDFAEPVDTGALAPGSIAMEWEGTPYFINAAWSRSNTRLTVSPVEGDWPASGTLILVLSDLRNPEGSPLPSNRPVEKMLIRELPYVHEGLPKSVDSVWLSAKVALTGFWDPDYRYSPVLKDSTQHSPFGDSNVGLDSRYARRVLEPESTLWVDTNTIDYWTDTYTLHWRKAERARFYKVFQRDDARSPWVLAGIAGPDAAFSVRFDPLVDKRPLGRQHIVVSGNADGTSPQDQAPLIEVKDGITPGLFGIPLEPDNTYAHPTGQLFTPVRDWKFWNISGDTEYIADILFNLEHISDLVPMEPLDTSVIPIVSIRESRGGRHQGGFWDSTYHAEFLSFKWANGTSAHIKVRVAGGKNGMQDYLTVNISNLADLAGNHLKVSALYGSWNSATELGFMLGEPYEYEE
jgi:hypothetical protein